MNLRNITFKGGLRAGLINLGWPFGALMIRRDSLVLRGGRRRFVIRKDQVDKIELHEEEASGEVWILHHKPELASPAIFWSLTPKALLGVAEDFGFVPGEE